MVVSTLGVVLSSYSTADAHGLPVVEMGGGLVLGTATLNGLLLGGRCAARGRSHVIDPREPLHWEGCPARPPRVTTM